MARAGASLRTIFTPLIAAGFLGIGPVAGAGVTETFSSESDFLDAAGSVSVESFEHLSADDGFRTTSMLTVSEFAISTDFLELSVQDNEVTGEFATDGEQYVDNAWPASADPALNVMALDFDAPIRAFGIHITDWGDFGEGKLGYSDDAEQAFEIASTPRVEGNEIFFGVVSAEPVTQVVLGHDINGEAYGIDEVLFAPEPTGVASSLTTCLSLAVVAALGRRGRGRISSA